MDFNALLLKYGNNIFKVDDEDELGVFMHLGGYKLHVRKDDLSLVEGTSVSEFRPLIDSVKKL